MTIYVIFKINTKAHVKKALFLTSYISTWLAESESTSGVKGGSQVSVISEALTAVVRRLVTDADITDASVVTVMSTKSPACPVTSLTPFTENTWKRYVVTGLNPDIVIFVSLNISWKLKHNFSDYD